MATTAEKARQAQRMEIRTNNPGTWIPVDEGDILAGEVIDLRVAHSAVQEQNGRSGDYLLLTVAKISEATGYEDPEQLKVHAFPTVLANELIALEPTIGERIRICYDGLGEARVKGQNGAARFTVTVEGRDPKEVAAQVYSKLKRQTPGQASVQAEARIVTDDIPF